MKIIKMGKKPLMECDFTIEKIYTFKCKRCHSKVEYTESDRNIEKFYKNKKFYRCGPLGYPRLEYGRKIYTYHTVECPLCGKKQAHMVDSKFTFTG